MISFLLLTLVTLALSLSLPSILLLSSFSAIAAFGLWKKREKLPFTLLGVLTPLAPVCGSGTLLGLGCITALFFPAREKQFRIAASPVIALLSVWVVTRIIFEVDLPSIMEIWGPNLSPGVGIANVWFWGHYSRPVPFDLVQFIARYYLLFHFADKWISSEGAFNAFLRGLYATFLISLGRDSSSSSASSIPMGPIRP